MSVNSKNRNVYLYDIFDWVTMRSVSDIIVTSREDARRTKRRLSRELNKPLRDLKIVQYSPSKVVR